MNPITPEAPAFFFFHFFHPSLLSTLMSIKLISFCSFIESIFFNAARTPTTINGVPGGGVYVPSISYWASRGSAKYPKILTKGVVIKGVSSHCFCRCQLDYAITGTIFSQLLNSIVIWFL